MNRRRQGAQGEALAVEYLQKKGYRILRQNYRYERDEIDIIAQENETLVFIEVKARRSTNYGAPIEAVTESKQKTIRAVAEGYLAENEIEDISCRFDVISILYKNGKPEIEHYVDAF
ncbi:MAG: YraN family protein [Ignavibacteriae bacterium]|nr:YraN family protein [Ignavibacteriota bacterium]